MTQIILARHGETEWNATETFRGRADIGLNETGQQQATLLGKHLSGLKVEAVYSSPLKRALQTAELVATPHQLATEATPSLTDLDYGQWQGLPLKEVKTRYGELYARWLETPQQVRMPDGESLDEVRERAVAAVGEIIGRHWGTVVLVAHRVVNKVLICALLGLDNSHFWNIKQDTAAITAFSYENGRFTLTLHNDTSHLLPLRQEPLPDF